MSRRVYLTDPDVGMKMVPNVAARVRHESGSYLVRANSDGFRCRHDFHAPRTPGTARVLVFGDSFTVGVGVREDRRYTDLLEAAIPELEVFNFGLTGSGTDQQYLAWTTFAREIDCDAVVVVPWVENIRRNPARYRVWNDRWADRSAEASTVWQPKPYFDLRADGTLDLHNVPVPKAVPFDELDDGEAAHVENIGRFAWLRRQISTTMPGAKDVLQRLTRFQPVPQYDNPEHPDWLLMRAILDRWHAELDVPMLVCPIPMYQHIEGAASPTGYQARFRELHRPEAGRVVHDVLAELQTGGRRVRRGMRFEHDIHFNEQGHAAFAAALAPAVRALLER